MALKQLLVAMRLSAVLITVAAAKERYFVVTPDQLELAKGAAIAVGDADVIWMRGWSKQDSLIPYGTLNVPGEIYVAANWVPNQWVYQQARFWQIAVHADDSRPISGHLYFPKSDFSGMESCAFTLPASVRTGSKAEYSLIKQSYYQHWADIKVPGSAWFRHEAKEAALGAGTQPTEQIIPRQTTPDEDDTIAFFTGGRAVAESLQLDRVLGTTASGEATVDVNTITGISITPMDWSKKNQGLKPELDPLAQIIPADQPAIFFSTLSALLATLDEAERSVTLIRTAAQGQSADAHIREHYEKQLGISLRELTESAAPGLIRSAAVTASDPYLQTGTDLAIIFETSDPAAMRELLIKQLHGTASGSGPFFAIARSADRSVCSYMAVLGNAVVVTNSDQQFQRMLNAQRGKIAALATAPEYIFFRDRYKLGNKSEGGFLILTDATIRRWCGPQWRIADSRRTRAAAVMSELQASHSDALLADKVSGEKLHSDLSVQGMGELHLSPFGVNSSGYGTLEFMTPIAEIPLDKVTPQEAEMYKRWRDSYEQNWRWFFDPIAISFSVEKDKLAGDLSIMPLIAGTDYAQMIDVVGKVKIDAHAGDPHDDLGHLVFAIDKDSPTMRPTINLLGGMVPGAGIDPLGWMGKWVSLFADKDPFWDELAGAKDMDKFMEANFHRYPLALELDISSRMKLTAFLVAVRAFIEQTAPQMVAWESLTYKDQPYVKMSPTAKAIADTKELKDVTLYYAITDDALIITLNQAVLDRALDRAAARSQHTAATTMPAGWLGQSAAARFDGKMLDLIRQGTHDENEAAAQGLAWKNLPILNEYRRIYPAQNPVEVYEKLWGARLLDPAGGDYVWNEKWQTMESSIYGSPAQPKDGPSGNYLPAGILSGDFGITFEDHGLRAAAEINRRGENLP